jgi:YD repeat-containing protein
VARTGSVEHEYNLAGEVVTEVSNDGTGNKTQFFDYDARGDQVGSTLTNGVNETKRYDADGRLIADVAAFP